MSIDFIVRAWNAWAPGISSRDDWRNWLVRRTFVQGEKASIPARVPKALQRRLSPLGRAVFNAADGCFDTDKSLPIVFSTAHGETNKSLEMLKAMQRGEEVSPTAFSLSVHNAIAGLFSIAYADHQEITVIAPAQDGIAPAFIEALGLLQEQHSEVLMVLYDEPLADFYPSLPFAVNAPVTCALALRVSLTGQGLPLRFCSSLEQRDDGEQGLQMLAFLQFLVADGKALALGNHRHSWEWYKI
ncbi:MAG: beta-ketoacyl synthase chain length factor [Gammaproteobacteria bacterium]